MTSNEKISLKNNNDWQEIEMELINPMIKLELEKEKVENIF